MRSRLDLDFDSDRVGDLLDSFGGLAGPSALLGLCRFSDLGDFERPSELDFDLFRLSDESMRRLDLYLDLDRGDLGRFRYFDLYFRGLERDLL